MSSTPKSNKLKIKNIKKRDILLDAIKGYAILLVVLGHAIQVNTPLFDQNVIFRIIYSFHMPLFMFVSGYIDAMSSKKKNIEYLIKKVKRLLIPFFSWFFIGFIATYPAHLMNIAHSLKELIKYPDNGLWFLWVLFFCFVIIMVLDNAIILLKQSKYLVFVLVLISFLIKLLPWNLFGIDYIKWYMFFICAGYAAFKYKKFVIKFKKIFLGSSLILFPLLVSGWMRDGNMLFIPYLKNHPASYPSNIVTYILNVYSLAVPIMGIILSFFVVKYLIKKYSLLKNIFVWSGINSLNIYAIQNFYYFSVNGNFLLIKLIFSYTLRIMLTFLSALTLSILLPLVIIKKNNFLRFLLLGENNR